MTKLHIMGGLESVRVFADHADARPSYVGHKPFAYDSPAYHRHIQEAEASGCGIFFSVNRTDGRGASAKNIVSVRSYFVDVDGCSTDEAKSEAMMKFITAPRKPSAVVETRNGLHAFFYAKPGQSTNPDDFRRVQWGLIKAFGGDKSAQDIARVLRLPGSIHQKDPENPFRVRIVHQLSVAETPYYDAEELLEAYPAPKIERPKITVTNSPKKWEAFLDDLSKWEPVPGQRNLAMLVSAGIAIKFGVSEQMYIDSMRPVVYDWHINRNVDAELRRVARWAFDKGNPLPVKAIRNLGIEVRDGLY